MSENGINPQVKSIEPIFHLNGKSLDANPVGQAQVCCPLGLSGGWDISTGRHWHSHGSKSLTFKMFFYISPAQVPERTITAYLDVQFNHDYITQLAMWQFWSFQKLVKGKIAEPQIHMISIVYPQAMDEILCFLQIFPQKPRGNDHDVHPVHSPPRCAEEDLVNLPFLQLCRVGKLADRWFSEIFRRIFRRVSYERRVRPGFITSS